MNKVNTFHFRILAIAPTSKGIGFALLEGETKLADWGVKSGKSDKNKYAIEEVKRLIALYRPTLLVLPDMKYARHGIRVQALNRKLISVAETLRMNISMLSHEQVRRTFFTDGLGTKDALAELLVKQFPNELKSRLPRQRSKLWIGEQYNMGTFDAVALAMVFRLKQGKSNLIEALKLTN